ncbi:MAG TPA: ABC transporter ATP-binding protein [Armatimonadaceae bacterium]|jgi:putative ABC transport system ATP-binding protein|nr:ABC transporter ATP-binding protein [Armatimonadaceae bacterium]
MSTATLEKTTRTGDGGKTEYVVRAKDLTKEFKMGTETVKALRGISLDIKRGEYVSIMGPSGSGKSTFFNMIGGLDKPNSGSVFINDVDMAQLDAQELAFLRCHTIGYIFQTFNLIPVMTALENVMLPTVFAGMPAEDGTARAMELLEIVGLEHRLHNKPSQLSGGQQQRVAIARSLANNPSIVLADEPTGNLDEKTGKDIINLLRELNREQGVTIISATHDHKMVDVSDRIVWIRDGHIDKIENREDIEIHIGSIGGSEDE